MVNLSSIEEENDFYTPTGSNSSVSSNDGFSSIDFWILVKMQEGESPVESVLAD